MESDNLAARVEKVCHPRYQAWVTPKVNNLMDHFGVINKVKSFLEIDESKGYKGLPFLKGSI